MKCNRCKGTGFLNAHLIPCFDVLSFETILSWLEDQVNSDVKICDCCGNGQTWYGTPGQHYSEDDPSGPTGPYDGGVAECH